MKFQILINILITLLSRKCVTAEQIAARYDISKRTAYRYIQELSITGVPIVAAKNVRGGYKIADSYRLPATFFTEKEFATLTAMVNSIKSQLAHSNELETLLEKLTAGRREYEEITISSSSLVIDGTGWAADEKLSQKLAVITNAVENSRLLKIEYGDGNGNVSERIIEPHALVLKNGRWYVYAFCRMREDFRLFKVARIRYAEDEGEFEKRPFDPVIKPINEWQNAGKPVEMTLKLLSEVRGEIEEWLGVDNVFSANDEIYAHAILPYNNNLVSEIMRYGNKVTVMAPAELKRDVISAAKQIVEMYK